MILIYSEKKKMVLMAGEKNKLIHCLVHTDVYKMWKKIKRSRGTRKKIERSRDAQKKIILFNAEHKKIKKFNSKSKPPPWISNGRPLSSKNRDYFVP